MGQEKHMTARLLSFTFYRTRVKWQGWGQVGGNGLSWQSTKCSQHFDTIMAARRLFGPEMGQGVRPRLWSQRLEEGKAEVLWGLASEHKHERVDEQWRTDNHLEALQASLNTQVCYRGFIVYRRQANSWSDILDVKWWTNNRNKVWRVFNMSWSI